MEEVDTLVLMSTAPLAGPVTAALSYAVTALGLRIRAQRGAGSLH
jgi:hypothetical protein